MPIEFKEYPNDFYSRKLSLLVVMRSTDKEPETMEDYFEALNLKATCIQTLAFLLGSMSKYALRETNPENLNDHLGNLAFMLMSFAAQMHDDEDVFRERFGLDK